MAPPPVYPWRWSRLILLGLATLTGPESPARAAQASADVVAAPSLFSDGWEPVDPDARRAFITKLDLELGERKFSRPDIVTVRTRELACYPTGRLVELVDIEGGVFTLLFSADRSTLLSGVAADLHRFNAGGKPDLSTDRAAVEYVCLFVGSSSTSTTRYRALPDKESLDALRSAKPSAHEEEPMRPFVLDRGQDSVRVQIMILYSGHVFKSIVRAHVDGKVEIVEHSSIMTGIFLREVPRRGAFVVVQKRTMEAAASLPGRLAADDRPVILKKLAELDTLLPIVALTDTDPKGAHLASVGLPLAFTSVKLDGAVTPFAVYALEFNLEQEPETDSGRIFTWVGAFPTDEKHLLPAECFLVRVDDGVQASWLAAGQVRGASRSAISAVRAKKSVALTSAFALQRNGREGLIFMQAGRRLLPPGRYRLAIVQEVTVSLHQNDQVPQSLDIGLVLSLRDPLAELAELSH